MATVASGLNSGSGFNSSDTITSTTLNNHVNNATVTNILTADIASSTNKTSGVTFEKMQHISTSKILGRTTAGEGDVEEVSLLDEDNMSSNSDTAVATQQSIKAYVDTEIDAFPITAPTGTTVATCGTVTLPGGLIVKFGQGTSTIDGDESFSFASPNFPNNCFAVIVGGPQHRITSKSVSGFTLNRYDDIDGNVTFEFLAIGN